MDFKVAFEVMGVLGLFCVLLYRSLEKDAEKRRLDMEKGIPVCPRTQEEYNKFVEKNIADFKEKYPDYHEQFTDEMVEEIIGGYIHLAKFDYKQKYDRLVEEGIISQVWFNRIVQYAVLKYANEK